MKRLSIASLAVLLWSGIHLGSISLGAEKYPVKPIIFIINVEAGSDADLLARPIMQKVSTILGQPIMIVNKPGGGGAIAYKEIWGAKPDGYTIGYAASSLLIVKTQGLLPYDYRDFMTLGSYAILTPIVVGSTKNQRPFKTIQEAISFAQSHPGEVSMATGSIGSTMWVAAMGFQEAAGLKLNSIPQAGAGGLIVTQVAGGHTDLGVMALPAAKTHIDAGNVRFLAIIGSKRAPGYDQVPTLKEIGYDVSIDSVNWVVAPPKIPRNIADKLIKALETAANDPEFHKFVFERNGIPFYLPGDKLIKTLDEQEKLYRRILEKAGLLKKK